LADHDKGLHAVRERRPLSAACPAGFPGGDREGFILITLLLIISVLLPVVIAFYAKTQINLLQAGNFRDTIQAVRMARSGLEGVTAILQADDDTYDGFTDKWANGLPAFTLADEKIDIVVTDEDRKLNVNKLVGEDGKVDKDMEARLKGLIKRLGGKEEIVGALADWIDEDDTITDPGGAESGYYKELGYASKNGPLDSLDELLLIKGFDKDLLVKKGLAGFLTVAPTDGKLNLNTAPAELLYDLTISSGSGKQITKKAISENAVTAIVGRREKEPFKTMEELKNLSELGNQAEALAEQKVDSSFFSVRIKCKLGKVEKDVTAVLKREKKVVTVISWKES
jgi:general secretion pathway protein K